MFSREDQRPMREAHCEALHPTLRSPCLSCPLVGQPKEVCAKDCERLAAFNQRPTYWGDPPIESIPIEKRRTP